jgi:hypothetical protein
MPLKKKKAKKKVTKKRVVKRRPAKKRVVKKAPARKRAAKKAIKKAKSGIKEKVLGAVTHYFPHVRAAVIKLKSPLSTGDSVRIKGHTTDFTQKVASMQIDRVPISSAKKGDEIGLMVDSRVRQHDVVYAV